MLAVTTPTEPSSHAGEIELPAGGTGQLAIQVPEASECDCARVLRKLEIMHTARGFVYPIDDGCCLFHNSLSFATDSRNRWHLQAAPPPKFRGLLQGACKLVYNGGDRLEASCVRLRDGDEVEFRIRKMDLKSEIVFWHGIFHETPRSVTPVAAPSGVSLESVLGEDELELVIGSLPLGSLSAFRGASRRFHAAVCRVMASPEWIDRRSLWQLIGGGWPLECVLAKFDADPGTGRQQVLEMLSEGSMSNLAGFPFGPHISKGWALVPANTLLERPRLATFAALLARVPESVDKLRALTLFQISDRERDQASRWRESLLEETRRLLSE